MPDAPKLVHIPVIKTAISDTQAPDTDPVLELRYLDYGDLASGRGSCEIRALDAHIKIIVAAGELPGLINALIDAAAALLPRNQETEDESYPLDGCEPAYVTRMREDGHLPWST